MRLNVDQFDSGYVSAWVVLEVTNTGKGWAQQIAFESDYTIYRADDSVTATGNFLYAFPRVRGTRRDRLLAPKARGSTSSC